MKKTKKTAKKKVVQNTYTRATKSMPHMINGSYILHVGFNKEKGGIKVLKALEAFMDDYGLETKGPACRVIIKRFLRDNGYLK